MYVLIPLIAVPGMIWAYRQLRFAGQWRFLIKPLAVLSLVLAGLLSLRSIPMATREPWSPTRLAPVVAWTKGYPLYPPPGEGPILVRMYGPVSSLIYLPTTLAATPTGVTIIGALINAACFILPAAWFILRATRGCGREIVLAAMAIFFVVAIQHPVLRYTASMVTIDAPAIGLATCAMAVLIHPKNPMRAALRAGVFTSLSIWSKQTFAPLLPAILLYYALTTPLKQALKLCGMVVGVFGAFSLLMLACFGWEPLYFNLVTVPGSRDWKWAEPTTAAVFLRSLRTMLWDSIPIGPMLIIAILIRHDWRISRNPWILPVIAALLILPLSMIAYAQVGGFSNNVAPVHYFSLLAAVVGFALASAGEGHVGPLSPTARVARIALVGSLVAALVARSGNWSSLGAIGTAWSTLREHPSEVAYEYTRSHPGQVWFPKQPLASLLAEAKARHFDEGLYAMQLAGVTVGPEWYASGLPENLRFVAYRGDRPEGPMPPPPGFDQVVVSANLAGWVLVREKTMNDER